MPKDDPVYNTKLVEAVERHRCLYDYKLKDYSSRHIVNAAWQQIAEEMGDTARECKDTWRNLRIVFTRNLKKPPNATTKRYYLLDKMSFLTPYLHNKTGNLVKDNCPPSPINTENTEINELDDNQDVFVKEENDSSTEYNEDHKSIGSDNFKTSFDELGSNYQQYYESTCIEPPSKRTKVNDVDQHIIKYVNSESEPKAENYRRLFLLSLLPDVEEMTHFQFRSFRKKTCILIDEVLEPCIQLPSNLQNN